MGTKLFSLPSGVWWSEQTVFSFGHKRFTRKDVVTHAANKDGGAHVDAEMEEFYKALASGSQTLVLDASNLQFKTKAPFDQSSLQRCQNLHLAMIRQFGHEVLATAAHFGWLKAT